MFDLSKVVKVVMVPMLDSSTLSAPVNFVLPELTKLFVHAKNGDVLLFCAFGTFLTNGSCCVGHVFRLEST